VLALCSLIVARRLHGCQRIFLTRLPVGHTHEDCDGIFGCIKCGTMKNQILTPEQFKEMLEDVFKDSTLPVIIKDILVTPDYYKLLQPILDKDLNCRFKNYTGKETEAQLQWIFEAVEPSEKHPLGVKTSYRAFVQDKVFEVIAVEPEEVPGYALNLRVRETFVNTYPLPEEEPLNIITEPPFGPIIPKSFIQGGASELDTLLERVKSYFGELSQTYSEWNRFRNTMPVDDYANHYIDNHAVWHIPFHDTLFNNLAVNFERNIAPDAKKEFINKYDRRRHPITFNNRPLQTAETTATVKHSGNSNAILPPTRRIISDPSAPKNPLEAMEQFLTNIQDFTVANTSAQQLKALLLAADTSEDGKKLSTNGTKPILIKRLV
jgi:hypothetical protein